MKSKNTKILTLKKYLTFVRNREKKFTCKKGRLIIAFYLLLFLKISSEEIFFKYFPSWYE